MNDKVNAAVALIEAAWLGRNQLVVPEGLLPADMDEATAMQDALAHRLNRRIVGWKLGLTSAAGQRAQQIPRPFTGRLFEGAVFNSPARLRAADFLRPLAEAEFGFRFQGDLPPRAEPYRLAEVREAIGSAFIGIELADTRWTGGWPFPIALLCADNGATGAYVIGKDLPNWQDIDFGAVETTLYFNGVQVASTLTGDDRPMLMESLLWAANDLSRRGIGVRRGELMTTGSACTPTAVPPGTRALARFEGIGEVELDLLVEGVSS